MKRLIHLQSLQRIENDLCPGTIHFHQEYKGEAMFKGSMCCEPFRQKGLRYLYFIQNQRRYLSVIIPHLHPPAGSLLLSWPPLVLPASIRCPVFLDTLPLVQFALNQTSWKNQKLPNGLFPGICPKTRIFALQTSPNSPAIPHLEFCLLSGGLSLNILLVANLQVRIEPVMAAMFSGVGLPVRYHDVLSSRRS